MPSQEEEPKTHQFANNLKTYNKIKPSIKKYLHKNILLNIEGKASINHYLSPLTILKELETYKTQVKMLPVNKQLLDDISFRSDYSDSSHEPCMSNCTWFHFSLILIVKAELWLDFGEAFCWSFPFDMWNCILGIIWRIFRISPQRCISRWEIFILPLTLIIFAVSKHLLFQLLKILHIKLIKITLHIFLLLHLIHHLILILTHLLRIFLILVLVILFLLYILNSFKRIVVMVTMCSISRT